MSIKLFEPNQLSCLWVTKSWWSGTYFWKKIKNPLYSNYTILFPKGIFADDSTDQITINEQHQKYRELYFQFETEYKEGPNITSVKFYIVRKGIDKMYTPQIRFAHEKVLQRDGYFFTEFKNWTKSKT